MNYSAASIQFSQVYEEPLYPLTPLRDIVTLVQYGTSARASERKIGLPILRMNNIQSDGWDLTDLKYIELSEADAKTYRLEKGDLLFNRTNSKELVGKCEVFHEEGDWVFASYLIRVRIDNTQAEPDYISAFLNTSAGRVQIDRVSRQIIGMSNINAEELRDLQVPLPPLLVQRKMVAELKNARESQRRKLEQAEVLLSNLDSLLLSRIGLTVLKSDNSLTYAIRISTVNGSKQIGADYFHPERIRALRAIQKAKNVRYSARLKDVTNFVRLFTTKYQPKEYLGLADVQSQTGELALTTEKPGKGQATVFQKNDVLFARLRPYLNKVWLAERDGVCSTEFHVLRIKESITDLLPDYLAAVLRSSVVVAQTKHMMTGNTHPRLANEDVIDLLIPIPDKRLQKEIIDELRRCRIDARNLREEALSEWEAAKSNFESKLLGGR